MRRSRACMARYQHAAWVCRGRLHGSTRSKELASAHTCRRTGQLRCLTEQLQIRACMHTDTQAMSSALAWHHARLPRHCTASPRSSACSAAVLRAARAMTTRCAGMLPNLRWRSAVVPLPSATPRWRRTISAAALEHTAVSRNGRHSMTAVPWLIVLRR